MSQSKTTMNKYQALLSQEKKTFHASDLALLWNITNQDTLNMTLKRLVDRGVLQRIHKGFYATTSLDDIDVFDLGFSYLNTYSYLSLETILAREGAIFQEVRHITLVSSKTDSFSINDISYKTRQLKAEFLHNTIGVKKIKHHFEADLERAVADILYYNPQYHLDNTKSVDFKKLKKYQQEIGYAS